MLAGAVARDARAAALPARRPRARRRCARSPPSTSCPSPPSPTRRTCASWPAPGARRFLARHGGLGERPGDIVDAAGRVLGRHRGAHRLHRRPAPRPGGRRRARAALRPAHRRRRQHRHRRPARGAGHDRRRACATRACTRRRREVDAVKLRYRAPAVPCTLRGDDDRARTSPSTAPPRARPRSSCAATPCWDAPQSLRDLRRDPRAVPGLLRGRATTCGCPAGRSCPRASTPRSCSRPRACSRSSPTSWASRSRPTRSSPPARRAFAPSTSRTSARRRGT